MEVMGNTKKDQWISAKEAAIILSKNSGHTVTDTYVRVLAREKKVASKPLDGRTNVYLRTDVEKIKVRVKKVADRQKVEQLADAPTTKASPDEKKSMAEDQPWYLPEQEKGLTQ